MPRGELVTPQLLREWPLPQVDEDGDKAGRGEVHVVGGAASTPGAVLLAGLAALRVGAGKLRITTVPQTAVALAVAVPEALVDDQLCKGADAYVVGPGVLEPEGLVDRVAEVAGSSPMVLDGAVLYDLPDVPEGCVLTPNTKELAALGDDPVQVAAERGAVVLTQGCVAAPDGRVWRDEAGSSALGTSGSGDVLAGLVGGLLARGAEPAQAAVWAQYLHGSAAARRAPAALGLLARELLEELPDLLAELS